MKPLWIRVGASEIDSVRVGRLADALELTPVCALGHLTAFCGAVARQRPDGDLSGVPDSLLEQWGAWTGPRGHFAAAVREVLVANGDVEDWSATFGRELVDRAKDADRKRGERSARGDGRPRNVRGGSADIPDATDGQSEDSPAGKAECPRQEKSNSRSRAETALLAASCNAREPHAEQSGELSTPEATAHTTPAASSPEVTAAGAAADAGAGVDDDDWAVRLTVALNQGITAELGEQPRVVVWTQQRGAAARIRGIGVELDFACRVVYAAAREQAAKGHDDAPRTLAWFVERVRRAWAGELERRRAADAPAPADLPASAGFTRPGRSAAQELLRAAEAAAAEADAAELAEGRERLAAAGGSP